MKLKYEWLKTSKKQLEFLTMMALALVLTACSNDESDQAKKAIESAAKPAVEQVEKVKTVAPAEESKPVTESEAPTDSTTVVNEPAKKTQGEVKGAKTTKASATSSEPQTHTIKGVVTQFRPLVTFAKPGDTIVWENMNGHDTVSMKGMIPEGAKPWKSKLGETFSLTVDKEGAYLFKCEPHASLGMMGAIIVDNADNLESIKESVDTSGEPKGMVKRVIRHVEKELKKGK